VSLAVQQVPGVMIVPAGPESVVAAAEGPGPVVVGPSDRWRHIRGAPCPAYSTVPEGGR